MAGNSRSGRVHPVSVDGIYAYRSRQKLADELHMHSEDIRKFIYAKKSFFCSRFGREFLVVNITQDELPFYKILEPGELDEVLNGGASFEEPKILKKTREHARGSALLRGHSTHQLSRCYP